MTLFLCTSSVAEDDDECPIDKLLSDVLCIADSTKQLSSTADDECIIDKLLSEIRRGTSLRRAGSRRTPTTPRSRGQTPQRELPPSPRLQQVRAEN